MSEIEHEVILDIRRRQELGVKKYGTTVAANPLSLEKWLQHAYEECLDQAIYLKRAMRELKTTNNALTGAKEALEKILADSPEAEGEAEPLWEKYHLVGSSTQFVYSQGRTCDHCGNVIQEPECVERYGDASSLHYCETCARVSNWIAAR